MLIFSKIKIKIINQKKEVEEVFLPIRMKLEKNGFLHMFHQKLPHELYGLDLKDIEIVQTGTS